MGDLRAPLRDQLSSEDRAAALARVRGRIDARLDTARHTSRRIFVLAIAAAVLLTIGFAIGRAGRPVAIAVVPSNAPSAPSAPLAVVTTEGGGVRQQLGDGSVVDLGALSELRTVEALPDRQTVALVAGRARFVVAKRTDRVFRVEAGALAIVVRGTTFTVVRSGSGALVTVEEGRVEVTAPGGVHTVEAGGVFAFPPSSDAPSPVPSGTGGTPAPSALAPAAAPWRPLARSGDYRSAYDALGAEGIASETRAAPDADTLFALADVARLSGHTKDAVAPLSRILRDHPGEPRTSLAALTLGKLELDELGAPRDAALHFDAVVRLGSPAALVEVASARRVEAWSRAGEPSKARAAAAEYRARFPGGRYDAEVTRWASGTP